MCKKIARVKRNLRLDTRMTQIDVILLFDGITLLQGIAEEKEKCNASASANFVQVLCKHFPLFYIVFSKVIPTFARKTLFYAILARFFTIFWLFSGSFWSWGGRGRKFKSCHSDQIKPKTVRFRLYFLHFRGKIECFSATFPPPEIPKFFLTTCLTTVGAGAIRLVASASVRSAKKTKFKRFPEVFPPRTFFFVSCVSVFSRSI